MRTPKRQRQGQEHAARPSRYGPAPRYAAERHWSRGTRQALVAALRSGQASGEGEVGSAVARCDQGELVELAVLEGIAGPTLEKLGQFLLPAHQLTLSAAARREASRHLSYLGLLRRCGGALEAAGLTWVVLKGPVLAELCYGRTVRGYTDLDLMVAPGQLQEAVSVLQGVGASLAEPVWPARAKDAKGELTLKFPGEGEVDLHWHLIYLGSARDRWKISTDELLGRRRKLKLGPVEVWALDQVDFAAHIALHAMFNGAQQLRRMLDIERTLANQPPEWGTLVERCRAWRVGLPVGVMLNRARVTLGAAVPDGIVWELTDGWLERLMMGELSRWVPAGPLPAGRSFTNGMIRSLRDGFAPSLAQFTVESWSALETLLRPTTKTMQGGNPAGGSAGAGEHAAYARYLQVVAGTDRYGH